MLDIPLKSLQIPEQWRIVGNNNFVDLEPDNDLPIDDVFHFFDEDLLNLQFTDYSIDLGYYGGYINRRRGFFRLIVCRGDFLSGELLESFLSRSTDAIQAKINYYLEIISEGKLTGVKGYSGDPYEFAFYSALESTSIKLTSRQWALLAQPKHPKNSSGT